MDILGVDIGGTGVKAAPVNTDTGELLAERFRLETPHPATPEAVTATVAEVAAHFNWQGPIGSGFPGVVRDGQILTAANMAKAWIGCNARDLFSRATGCPVAVLNDADAAGYAEMRFGAGKGMKGVVLIVTLGTGIGTALFVNGMLVPNTELGHIELEGKDAEKRAAASVRERKELSWKKWSRSVDAYLNQIYRYLWPDLIVIGGGVSKNHEKFLPLLTVDTMIVPAQMRNEAGIVGAALGSLYAQKPEAQLTLADESAATTNGSPAAVETISTD
jgi:polyphosphate glucokinase